MIKKLILGVTGSAVGLALMGWMIGHDAGSYLRTSVGSIKDSVHDSMPIEFHIERAQQMVQELDPQISRNKTEIVKEEVALERLTKQVNELETTQEQAKAELLRMKTDVESGVQFVHYAGRKYSVDQVKQDMANRFERFKTNDERLFNLRRYLGARQKSLDAARQQFEQMLAARAQLIADIEKLKARDKMIQITKSTSQFELDDSALARTNQLVSDIEARLDVAERLLTADTQFHIEIPLDPESDGSGIVEQMTEYFGAEYPDPERLAAEVHTEPQL